MKPIANHPTARYRVYRNAVGRVIIECRCSRCGPSSKWQRQCPAANPDPDRLNQHLMNYAMVHAHGLRPVVPQ